MAKGKVRYVAVDADIYVVDDAAKTYRVFRPNPMARTLTAATNAKNKASIKGYRRVYR